MGMRPVLEYVAPLKETDYLSSNILQLQIMSWVAVVLLCPFPLPHDEILSGLTLLGEICNACQSG